MKPKNIVLSNNQNIVKIIDLGLAMVYKNAQDHGREVSGEVGTYKYMSPEQLGLFSYKNINKCQISLKTDIWAFGCILLEYYTGKQPYYDLQTMSDTPE